MNCLRQWRSELRQYSTDDAELNNLVSSALSVLDEVIGFLSNSENLKLIQRRRSLRGNSKQKICDLCAGGISKTLLKKIINGRYSDINSCDDLNGCMHSAFKKLKERGVNFAPKLERKMTAKGSKREMDFNNPFHDASFDPNTVLSKRRSVATANESDGSDKDEYSDEDDGDENDYE